MAERIAVDTWSIQGETITLPVTITTARLTAAVFAAPAASARRLLDGTPLRPVSLFGRAVGLLMCVHYDEWALKTYDEVGVGLLAAGPGGRPGLHLVDLPVTGAFTQEAGRDFWALPKWVMDADLGFTPDETTVTVRDGGAEAMTATLRHGRLRLPFPIRAWLPSWSYLDHGAQAGRLLRGRVPMRLAGVRAGRGDFQVRLGDHPMAGRMRALGMLGRPWLTVHADSLTGPLGTFRAV
jgi:Acetoacetate decarboxylase (ADC)